MVRRVADAMPTYVVKCEKTGKRQVLHWAWLLLWQAKFDGEPIRVNCIMIDSSLPGTALKTQPKSGVKACAVLRCLVYGLSMTLLQSMKESSDPKTPHNGMGHRIPEVGK